MVIIMGAGGIGFYLAVLLARLGIDTTVYDDDNFSGGLGAARLPAAAPSTLKVDALKGFIAVSMRDKRPITIARRFTGDEIEENDLLVDCSDMPILLRKEVWDKVKKTGARAVRVSYDGRSNVVVVAEGLAFSSNPRGGYADMPTMALSFVASGVGATVVQKIVAGLLPGYIDFQINLDSLISPQTTSKRRKNVYAKSTNSV